MAVFVSSHLLAEIELIADRVAIIHNGRILKTGLVRELISKHRAMEFRVDDAERAAAIVRAAGIEPAIHDDLVLAPIEETETPPIIDALTRGGVAVFHARPHVQTLEDMFLEATGGESVG